MSKLLNEVHLLDAYQRGAWLARLPACHQDLRPALWRALQLGTSQASAITPFTFPRLSSAARALEFGKRGLRVGPYRLLCRLGGGGMGVVWCTSAAKPAESERLALKLPVHSRDRSGADESFARERDILRSLNHPNIVRFVDSGISGDGIPFIAMEYVAGRNLMDWCRQRKTSLEQRRELFLQLLGAVHYAHARLILHRDLKPSNVLVDTQGQVRLIDFGIARFATAPPKVRSASLEALASDAFTPRYASPEQVRGEPCGAQADIYSLGVMLYELVHDRHPYQSSGSALAHREMMTSGDLDRHQEAIANEAPQRSRGARSRSTLDHIIFKAMAPIESQRYQTVASFWDDLRSLSGLRSYAHTGKIGSTRNLRLTKTPSSCNAATSRAADPKEAGGAAKAARRSQSAVAHAG